MERLQSLAGLRLGLQDQTVGVTEGWCRSGGGSATDEGRSATRQRGSGSHLAGETLPSSAVSLSGLYAFNLS